MDVTSLKGVGSSIAVLLARVGIRTVEEVVENIPRRYDDFSNITPIDLVEPGPITIQATIERVTTSYSRKGLSITKALARDDTGVLQLIWFSQPYRHKQIEAGQQYFLSGQFAQSHRYLALVNPACERVSSFPLHTARVLPIYKLTKGLSSGLLRKITKQAIDAIDVVETLPTWMVREHRLMPRKKALEQMHFPSTMSLLDEAKRRIGFEEVFELSLASALNRRDQALQHATPITLQSEKIVEMVEKLPFSLTTDQRKVAWKLFQSMSKNQPMNYLLQGDVGAGKTVVAAMLAYNVALHGAQTAFMAPTELLARQHAQTLKKLIPIEADTIRLLSSSTSRNERQEIIKGLADGSVLIVIGTHALLEVDIRFKTLSLVIIDEQHRFGVDQRKALQKKASLMPHVLHMTATPIPRSIALTLYGELDHISIREKPVGRLPIATHVDIPENRQKLYSGLVAAELAAGKQAYVVCPIIDSAESGNRALGVSDIARQITPWLGPARIGVLHGRLKNDEKQAIMQQFTTHELDVLVSTTVIEVGVDVPNASVMIIEGADQFGLAQLHQLRGRVGRGDVQSHCYLVTTTNDSVPKRLEYVARVDDGFKLAEYDLEQRGPGAIYGTIQHGALDLRVAKLTDYELIKSARTAADQFMQKNENLIQYPKLAKRIALLRTVTNLN